jgi:hypothetical protein
MARTERKAADLLRTTFLMAEDHKPDLVGEVGTRRGSADGQHLPRRVAEVVHALMEAQGSHAADRKRALLTTREVMEYDTDALTIRQTRYALNAALRLRLVDRAAGRYWFPTNAAWEMRRALEDYLFAEESGDAIRRA